MGDVLVSQLSLASRNLWAKKSCKNGNLKWLPLVVHAQDAASVAKSVWHKWLSEGVKEKICDDMRDCEQGLALLVFLASVHDLGKATPVFQSKQAWPPCYELDQNIEEKLIMTGLPMKENSEFSHGNKTPHALATQILLQNAGLNTNAAVIVGAHHGKPPTYDSIIGNGPDTYGKNYYLDFENNNHWLKVQDELISYSLTLAGYQSLSSIPSPNMTTQVLLSGLIIMIDWIISNEKYFPLFQLEETVESGKNFDRGKSAWNNISFPEPWKASNDWMKRDLYDKRFSFKANPVQVAAQNLVNENERPGIMIIEAPMGFGKTEAALICAEVFAYKSKRTGLFFALPSQATSDSIFHRVKDWIDALEDNRVHSINLAHGKAQFNDEFESLKPIEGSTNIGIDEEKSVLVHEWFSGQKKSLLADFVVGTIDQLLLAAVKQRHVMLRHLGLTNKVIVIDEVHAYDAYMSQFLYRMINWLGSYGIPVIVLSATLPRAKRKSLIEAYLNRSKRGVQKVDPLGRIKQIDSTEASWELTQNYPLITYTEESEIRQHKIEMNNQSNRVVIDFVSENSLPKKLESFLMDGGCAGIIVNSVRKAQRLAREMSELFGEGMIVLIHSQFINPDRTAIEKTIVSEVGKPNRENRRPRKKIYIGTQILEQSLDIDFDLLVTELCPMDLLLQRIGRLHRHQRKRPGKLSSPRCLILENDDSSIDEVSSFIYGKYLLIRTKVLLPSEIILPEDIPRLVQRVYDESIELSPLPPDYDKEKEKWLKLLDKKEKNANNFRISQIFEGQSQNMLGWLDADISTHVGEAAVRDSEESIEVLLVCEKENEEIGFLPWISQGKTIPLNKALESQVAKEIARQRIRLPVALCLPHNIDKTIAYLEKSNKKRLSKWQESDWIKGELVLILDKNLSAKIENYKLDYHPSTGLSYDKEANENE